MPKKVVPEEKVPVAVPKKPEAPAVPKKPEPPPAKGTYIYTEHHKIKSFVLLYYFLKVQIFKGSLYMSLGGSCAHMCVCVCV